MKRSKKVLEVKKFGGTEELGSVKQEFVDFTSGLTGQKVTETSVPWQGVSVEEQSQTKLEADEGYGNNVVIRCFKFGVNPEAFSKHTPTKQELFNSHYKGIEIYLWKDGLKVVPEIDPRIIVAPDHYQIFVAATPQKGQLLSHQPKTLKEIANG